MGGAKAVARGVASALVLPAVLSFRIRARLLGRGQAFESSSQWLALVPGVFGQFIRRAFLAATTPGCGPDVVVGFGTVFSSADVRLDGNAYIGPQCNIGWAHVERDALVAAGVMIPSGPHTHGTARLDIPMRDQPGRPQCVTVGEGAWIGNGAIVLADVGRHAIVAAGAVVTRPVPDYGVVAGVPARLLRDRRSPAGPAPA